MGFGMPQGTGMFGKEGHPEAGRQMLGPLTEEGTREISLLPLEEFRRLTQRPGLSIGSVVYNRAPPEGLPLILLP